MRCVEARRLAQWHTARLTERGAAMTPNIVRRLKGRLGRKASPTASTVGGRSSGVAAVAARVPTSPAAAAPLSSASPVSTGASVVGPPGPGTAAAPPSAVPVVSLPPTPAAPAGPSAPSGVSSLPQFCGGPLRWIPRLRRPKGGRVESTSGVPVVVELACGLYWRRTDDPGRASVGGSSGTTASAGHGNASLANDGAAHYFPVLRGRSSVDILPDSAWLSSPLACAGFEVTSPAIDGDGGRASVTCYTASRKEAQQWVDAIQAWLLPWRDVAARAATCFASRADCGGASSAVGEAELRAAMVTCTAAVAAVHVAGGFVKAFGHAMADHAELIRVGEAIPVAGPAFALLATIARQMDRYREEREAVSDVLKTIARLTNLAATALGTIVDTSLSGLAVVSVEDVLMELELAAVHIQVFLHSKEERRNMLLLGMAGPRAIAARLDKLQSMLGTVVGVDGRVVLSEIASQLAGMTATVPWTRPWPYVQATVNTDAKLYKNDAVVGALNKVFGRKDKDSTSVLVAVLSGQAGVGKSETAKCYIREQAGHYSGGVVLLNVDNPTLARESLRSMSGLPAEVVDSVSLKEYLRHNTSEHGRMLLVLDNADALGGPDHWLAAWLPHMCPQVDVLLTTRLSDADAGLCMFRRTLPGVCEVVPVHVLSPDAAATALRSFIGDDYFFSLTADDQERERVAVDFLAGPHGMGGLLLALALAGRTIATCPGMTASKYVDNFEQENMALLDEEADVSVPTDSPRGNVQASVRLSLSALHEQSPLALSVLQLLCVFPPDGIPPNSHEVAVDV